VERAPQNQKTPVCSFLARLIPLLHVHCHDKHLDVVLLQNWKRALTGSESARTGPLPSPEVILPSFSLKDRLTSAHTRTVLLRASALLWLLKALWGPLIGRRSD